jgi:hypothetical protein
VSYILICGPRKEEVTERASDKLREQVLPYSEVSVSDLEKVIMDCDQCIYSILHKIYYNFSTLILLFLVVVEVTDTSAESFQFSLAKYHISINPVITYVGHFTNHH